VQYLGLKIKTAAFLSGMGYRKELGDLSLKIFEHGLEITQLLRFYAADEPGDRRFDIDGVTARIKPEIRAAGQDSMGDKLPGMADMGCRADACRKKNEARLLRRHRNPAGPALCPRQIAFPERAETAEIAEREVKRLITGEKFMVPRPQ
jgi:hypothetical protein